MRQRKWLVVIGAFIFFLVAVSAYAEDLVLIRGWGYKKVFYDGVTGHEGTAEGVDMDGEVGHPMDPYGEMTAPCASSHGEDVPSCYVGRPLSDYDPSSDQWAYDVEIASGSLPPGLSIVKDRDAYGDISGIPTERGHWIVILKVKNIQWKGKYYADFSQQLRFHISGTGKVIE